MLGRAGETGHQRRVDDAKKGVVAWKTPLDVANFMLLDRKNSEQASMPDPGRAYGDAAAAWELQGASDVGFQNSTVERTRAGLEGDLDLGEELGEDLD